MTTSQKQKKTKEFRFGWCANGIKGNHDWCPGRIGEVACTCWCHPAVDSAAN